MNKIVLSQTLELTLTPEGNKAAEQNLKSFETQEDYGILLIQIIVDTSSINVKIAASIALKNLVKKYWTNDDETSYVISDRVKSEIKKQILHVMISSDNYVQKQLSETISLIGQHDFPQNWGNLMHEIIEKINEGNYIAINGILQTCHSLFKKYRSEARSDKLFLEIKEVIKILATPLTNLINHTLNLIDSNNSDKNALDILWNSVLFICKVFHSINHQDLPEFFEDNMKDWMSQFHRIFEYSNPLLVTNNSEMPGILEQVKTEVCEIICLYQNKYDEEFTDYLPRFISDSITLIHNCSSDSKYDNLVSTALDFLSLVVQKARHQELFKTVVSIQQICEAIIVPSIEFRQSDQDMFTEDPDEYIKLDIDGSNAQSRRKSACELVKSLCRFYENEIVGNFSQYIQELLRVYTENPQVNWKHKDSALFLITTVASKGGTEKQGVTMTTEFVDLKSFYKNHILPELQGPLDSNPVIKADCIKYLMAFRNKIDRNDIIISVEILFNIFRHPSVVVHSYAAAALNKLMMLKDDQNNPILTIDHLNNPVSIFSSLCGAMTHAGSGENEYIMCVIMRSLCILNSNSLPVMSELVNFLKAKLDQAIKEPKKPLFNHYLMECFALCIKIVCKSNQEFVKQYEAILFPSFEPVLQQNIEDFQPYAFQLFSLMLEYNETISGNYIQLFPFLVDINLWDTDANIPGLIRLLLCYLEKSSGNIILSNLDNLMKIFFKLNRSRAMDTFAFALISAIMIYVPKESTYNYLKTIFLEIFKRLSKPNFKTVKYLKGFIYFVSNLFCVFSASDIINLVDTIQSSIFQMIIESAFLNYLPNITDEMEKKICLIGTTKLLFESQEMIQGNYSYLWKQIVRPYVQLFTSYNPNVDLEAMLRYIDVDDSKDRNTALNQLGFVRRKVADPCPTMTDVRVFIKESFHKLAQVNHERLSVLFHSLEKTEQDAFRYGLGITF